MTDAELQAIRERNAARRARKAVATEGPWHFECGSLFQYDELGRLVMEWIENGRTSTKNVNRDQDGAFMAAARNDPVEDDVDALLAEVQRLRDRSVIQKLIDQVSAARHDHLEIFAAAFVAKTSLDPRECELVEEHVGTEIRWHFRNRLRGEAGGFANMPLCTPEQEALAREAAANLLPLTKEQFEGPPPTAEQAMAELWGLLCPDAGPGDYAAIVREVEALRAANEQYRAAIDAMPQTAQDDIVDELARLREAAPNKGVAEPSEALATVLALVPTVGDVVCGAAIRKGQRVTVGARGMLFSSSDERDTVLFAARRDYKEGESMRVKQWSYGTVTEVVE